MELVAKGKVKDVYAVSEDELEFFFSDRISVFDQIIPSEIPGKGEALNRESAFWFRKTEDLGIKTHFISTPEPNRMRVKRVRVIHDYNKLTGDLTNFQIPLECVLRWYCAGSYYRAIQKGKVDPTEAGFPEGYMPKYGEKLPQPVFEVTTKFEATDRKLDRSEALQISGLTESELDDIKNICIRIDEMIQKEVGKRGLIHVDGKKEFAMDENRNLMVIDTFGTADEDRFWDKEKYENGEIVEFSKEFVRKYYENEVKYKCPCSGCENCEFSYKELLDKTREEGFPDPAIPALPKDMIERTSSLYKDLFTRITGEDF